MSDEKTIFDKLSAAGISKLIPPNARGDLLFDHQGQRYRLTNPSYAWLIQEIREGKRTLNDPISSVDWSKHTTDPLAKENQPMWHVEKRLTKKEHEQELQAEKMNRELMLTLNVLGIISIVGGLAYYVKKRLDKSKKKEEEA